MFVSNAAILLIIIFSDMGFDVKEILGNDVEGMRTSGNSSLSKYILADTQFLKFIRSGGFGGTYS